MHYFSNLFDKLLRMFRTILTTLADSQQNYHEKYLLLCIQCWDTPDDGQWTCPKHVKYFIK